MKKIIAVYADLDKDCNGIGHLRTTVTDAMTGEVLHTIEHERATVYAGLIMGITWAWLSVAPEVIYTNNTAVYSAFMREYRPAFFTFHDGLDLATKSHLAWCENKVNELGTTPPLQLWRKAEMNYTDIRASFEYLRQTPRRIKFVEDFDLAPCNYDE